MRASDRTQLAVTGAVLLASLTLLPLTQDRAYLTTGGLVVLLLSLLSVVLRRLRVTESVVLLGQLVLWAGLVCYLGTTLPGSGETWRAHLTALVLDGASHMQTQSAPMTVNFGVRLMLVAAVGLILILTDLLVSGVHRAGWSIAPLSALFLIPALGLPYDTGAMPFLAVAAGYLLILGTEGLNTTAAWTRGLTRDHPGSAQTPGGVVVRAAAYMGVPTVVLALVLAPFAPTISLDGLGLGRGSGDGPLQLADPTLDLKRNLTQTSGREVITYQTSDGRGEYLRMASLPVFNSRGWNNTEFPLVDQVPAVPGLSYEPAERVHSTITVGDFGGQYLPLPYAPRSFQAGGHWGVDPSSLVVVGKDSTAMLNGLRYEADSARTEPTAAQLATAVTGLPSDSAITAPVPTDLPVEIRDLTAQVIASADAETPAEKATAIQDFLRGDRFTYDTRPRPGSGYTALADFLLRDHRGYCEQFAGAMAAMARIAGIPSRVAVGFLPGRKDGDTWHVKASDMHAWPELWYAGLGWVRYEPTKSVASAPRWTQAPDDPDSSTSESAQPSTSSSASAPSTEASARPDPGEQQAPTSTTAGPGWARPVGFSALGLAVLVVASLPGAIRIRRRSARLADDEPPSVRVEGAWAEVRDTVVDLGGRWPDGSPRRIGSEVADRLDASASDRMGQLATLVERSRYARTLDSDLVPTDLAAATRQIRRALAGNRTRLQRVRAVVAPRSIARSLRRRLLRRPHR